MEIGFGIVFSTAGTILIFAGFLVLRSSYLKMRTWTTVPGTVIGYREIQQGGHYDAEGKIDSRPASRSGPPQAKWTAYDPQVQFAAVDGKMITFTSSMGSNKRPYQIGAAVKVLYPPDDPEKATIKSFTYLCLPAAFAFLFAAVFLGIGLSCIFR